MISDNSSAKVKVKNELSEKIEVEIDYVRIDIKSRTTESNSGVKLPYG